MAEHGVDISGHRPTRLDAFAGDSFTRVITLCDRARENCGELPAEPAAVHWSIPNPAQAHPPDLDAFRVTTRELQHPDSLPAAGADCDLRDVRRGQRPLMRCPLVRK